MITGVAAHAIVRQPSLVGRRPDSPCRPTHAGGWPIPLGGSQAISDALAVDLVAHGGEIVTDHEVASLDELTARAVVLDVTPRALIRLAGRGRQPDIGGGSSGSATAAAPRRCSSRCPARRGPMSGAGCRDRPPRRHRAQIAASSGRCSPGGTRHPPMLVSQPSRFDPSRAPGDAHALWTYTHVPAGSTLDQTEAVTRVIEQYAPGFRDLVIASRATGRAARGRQPNYIGGDIAAERRRSGSSSPGPCSASTRGARRCAASTSAGVDRARPGRARSVGLVRRAERASARVRHPPHPPRPLTPARAWSARRHPRERTTARLKREQRCCRAVSLECGRSLAHPRLRRYGIQSARERAAPAPARFR
jgi:hypothetical protein